LLVVDLAGLPPLAFAKAGRPVTVLEGAPSFGAIGYGIQFPLVIGVKGSHRRIQ